MAWLFDQAAKPGWSPICLKLDWNPSTVHLPIAHLALGNVSQDDVDRLHVAFSFNSQAAVFAVKHGKHI
jgi:hypothetical protein